ncbi:MAG: peptidylprolyl isomerase [Chloroflexi bacterium]|nr:peptidylprolyl isomerase [Chloroflexota bacterium]
MSRERRRRKASTPAVQRPTPKPVREERLRRWLLVGAGAFFLLIGAIVGLGFWQQYFLKPRAPIVLVGGQPITLQTYAQVLTFERFLLQSQLAALDATLQRAQSGGTTPAAQAALGILQQQRNTLNFRLQIVETQVFDNLVEADLLRQEAQRRGIAITDADIDAELVAEFAPAPPGLPEPATTPANPEATPTPRPTPTPIPFADQVESGRQQLSQLLAQVPVLTVDEVRQLVIAPTVLKDKLRPVFGAEVPTTAEQIRARHIQTSTEQDARKALDRLSAGEDFAAIAKDMSIDLVSRDKGGELGWLPRGVLPPEFDQAAFSLQPGQRSDVVRTSLGYQIVEVEEREQRAIDPANLELLRGNAIDRWLAQQKAASSGIVTVTLSQEQMDWARQYVQNKLTRPR